MTKRILQIISTAEQTGAIKQFGLLATNLSRDEFDLHVVVIMPGGDLSKHLSRTTTSTCARNQWLDELREMGIPVHVIGNRWALDPSTYYRLRSHIARLKPNLVQTWCPAANLYGRLAARSCGVPAILASERCFTPGKNAAHWMMDRHLARSTERIVANSQAVRDWNLRHGIPDERFEVIPNAVTPPPENGLSRDELLDWLRLPADVKLIGMATRLIPQKQLKDAIWAADLLKVIRDDVHLLILGDGPLRNRIRRYRDQIEIQDRVHLLGHRDDVRQIMPHLDLFWSTSAYESQSNAVMEAMASGTAVMATDIPGNRELIDDGTTGILIPFHGADFRRRRADFARQSTLVLDDEQLLGSIGNAARHQMLQYYGVESMVQRYRSLYHRCHG